MCELCGMFKENVFKLTGNVNYAPLCNNKMLQGVIIAARYLVYIVWSNTIKRMQEFKSIYMF